MTKGIPAPAMPPRRSSIAQTAEISEELSRITEESPRPAPVVTPATAVDTPVEPETTEPNPVSASASPAGPETAQGGRRRGGRGRGRDTAPARASESASEGEGEEKEKTVLLKLTPSLKARMVATATWTAPHTGMRTQQAFIRQAIVELCERLEQDHNNGESFPKPANALLA